VGGGLFAYKKCGGSNLLFLKNGGSNFKVGGGQDPPLSIMVTPLVRTPSSKILVISR